MKEIRILSIHVNDREIIAPQVRNILSENKRNIRSSEGLTEVTEEKGGLMMFELKGEIAELIRVESLISKLDGVSVQSLSFLWPIKGAISNRHQSVEPKLKESNWG